MKTKLLKKNIKKIYKMNLIGDLRTSVLNFKFVMIRRNHKILVLTKNHLYS